jgi:acetyl-CoA carboxylase carboxyltransferase component
MKQGAERGYIGDVIMPQATRPRIARALAMLRGKTVEMPGASTIIFRSGVKECRKCQGNRIWDLKR